MITLNDIWFQTSQQVRQQLPQMNQQLHLPQLPHQVQHSALSEICSLNEQKRTMPRNISARRMKIYLILFQRIFYKMFKQHHRTFLHSFVYQDVWRRRTLIIEETLCPEWRSLMWIAVGHHAVPWVHPISVTMTKWNASAKTLMLAEEPWMVLWVGRHRVTILQINQQPLHQVIYLAILLAICPKKWQGICMNEQMNMKNQDIIWSIRFWQTTIKLFFTQYNVYIYYRVCGWGEHQLSWKHCVQNDAAWCG